MTTTTLQRQKMSSPFGENDQIVCDCSDDSLFDLIEGKTTTDHFLWSAIIKKRGYCNSMIGRVVVQIKPYAELNQESKDLVYWCVDFLIYAKTNSENGNRNWELGKYISLWSFIYDFLKIEKNGGIDYLLMNLLNWYDFAEHGSGIRCSWLKTDAIINRVCSEERAEIITNWIKNAPK